METLSSSNWSQPPCYVKQKLLAAMASNLNTHRTYVTSPLYHFKKRKLITKLWAGYRALLWKAVNFKTGKHKRQASLPYDFYNNRECLLLIFISQFMQHPISVCILGKFPINMGWKNEEIVHRKQVKQAHILRGLLLVGVVMNECSSHDSSIDIKQNY